jgi:[ribosomal protein S5]-alanine N-acetyltransferase
MAFLRVVASTDTGPVLKGNGLLLRCPTSGDYAQWAELRARSRDFLEPWEPSWTDDELSRTAFRRRIKHYQRDLREENGYAFFMFRRHDGALLGGLSLSNLRRGVTQSVTLGYWMGRPHAGRGWMTEAVRIMSPFVFDSLGLHRLEAACIPSNTASIRVLEKCGFVREGFARSYLKINGIWQDHFLFALIADHDR